MKLIKGLALLSFLVVIFFSCFDPPEFGAKPEIEFEKIEFIDSPTPSKFDSLILYIRFKDGDGDLGFTESTDDISNPYHNAFFYQEKKLENNKDTIEALVTKSGFVGNNEYDLLDIPDPKKGKLVFFRTRSKFTYLPRNYHCSDYEYLGGPVDKIIPSDGRRLLIEKADRIALDRLVKIVDSIPRVNPQYYQIRDTLYYKPNQDHYNIEVDFLVKDPTAPGGFREFDWREEFCTTFDGRFPVFSDKSTSIQGTLRYSMTSLGFTSLFSIKTLKLRVWIKDRARNESNMMVTPEFTLLD